MSNDFTKYANNLFSTTSKIPYAGVAGNGRLDNYPVFSTEMRNTITKVLYKETGAAPSKSVIDQIQSTIAAEALYNGETKDVSVRSAKTPEGIEIDLNNPSGQCIEIKKGEWNINSPVSSFYRPDSSRELAVPKTGGTWEIFKKHFRTKTDEDLQLVIQRFLPVSPAL